MIIQPLNGGEVQSVDFGKAKMRGVMRAGPNHVLAEVSRTRPSKTSPIVSEQIQATSINIRTGAPVPDSHALVRDDQQRSQLQPGRRRRQRQANGLRPVLRGRRGANRSRPGRVRSLPCRSDSGVAAMVQMGDTQTGDFLFKTDGTVIARTMYDRETARWSMQLRKDGKWVDAYVVTAPLDGPSMEGLSLDEKSVVMSIRRREGRQVRTSQHLDRRRQAGRVLRPGRLLRHRAGRLQPRDRHGHR